MIERKEHLKSMQAENAKTKADAEEAEAKKTSDKAEQEK